MFWSDHAPPHFHALYGEFEVLINIKTLGIMEGTMSHRALSLVLEWAKKHRKELIENWKLCELKQTLREIAPLE